MTPARAAVTDACRLLAPTSLAEVMAVADLQTRVDRKYLIPTGVFTELVGRLQHRLGVLEIDGGHTFDYESVYFDTPGLLAHHQHAHGRRRRFKVRTRTYLDSAQSVLEVKMEGGRGETVKHRHPYDLAARYELDEQARQVVGEQLGDPATARLLQRSLITRYLRTTLVDRTGSRLTCDVDLAFSDDHRTRRGPEDLVLVESKTVGAAASADTILWRLGHRPVSVSKYCAGLALLHPGLPANRWSRTLRRHFGWVPVRDDPGDHVDPGFATAA